MFYWLPSAKHATVTAKTGKMSRVCHQHIERICAPAVARGESVLFNTCSNAIYGATQDGLGGNCTPRGGGGAGGMGPFFQPPPQRGVGSSVGVPISANMAAVVVLVFKDIPVISGCLW